MIKKILFSVLILSHLGSSVYALPKIKRVRKAPSTRVVRQPSVAQLSRLAQTRLDRKLTQITHVKERFPARPLRQGHPFTSTFQVQSSTAVVRPETASAFAIELNGKTWGVTASHVMKNISFDPYVKVQSAPHTFHLAPIKTVFRGNPEGMDIALFEIPQEVLPFVNVLKPAEHAPTAGEKLNIPGFTGGQPLLAQQQKVLYATPLKLFLQNTSEKELRGFCGSPLLGKDSKVHAIYVGYDSAMELHMYDWFADLPMNVQLEMPNLHYAIPVQILQVMANWAEKNSSPQAGKWMHVLNKPIALLHPNEYIISVEQFRNGEKLGRIHKHPLVDPEHLEQFFELEQNDILRVTIRRPQTRETPTAYKAYDINVSTGEVTELSEKDLFGPLPDWRHSNK